MSEGDGQSNVVTQQKFSFPDPRTKDPHAHRIQRLLEMVPGGLTWLTIFGMLVLSFIVPVWVAVFIIAFDVYWILRTIYVSFYSRVAHRAMQRGKATDWFLRLRYSHDLTTLAAETRARIARNTERCAQRTLSRSERQQCKWALRSDRRFLEKELPQIDAENVLPWEEIMHVACLPTAGEDAEILIPSLEAIRDSVYPNEKIIIVIATEEREERAHREEKVRILRERFEGVFADFIVTTHKVAAGELKCKASNVGYAARYLMRYFDRKGIDYTRVLFSNLDCDTVVHPQYFAALTFLYVTDPKRLQRAYQPIPMYHNNLWDTNAFVRVIVTSSSFWHMFQSTRREMVTFSSHAEPFDTLVKVNFWPVNMISEDSVIYWKCQAYFHGDYEVKPIPLPISLDAVLAKTYWGTIKNQYKQTRRWAYGIENFPVTMRAIWPDKKMPLLDKLRITFEMLEGHHSWATTPLMLALLGWLPLWFGSEAFNQSVIAHNLPMVTSILMNLALVGLVFSMFLSFATLPPRPARHSKKRYIYMFFQWFLFPITAPFLGSMPAIESQTRIMFGKYFGEFWVTEKVRHKDA